MHSAACEVWQPAAPLFAKAEALLQAEVIDEEGMNPCGTG
jgi:hypothetical protein